MQKSNPDSMFTPRKGYNMRDTLTVPKKFVRTKKNGKKLLKHNIVCRSSDHKLSKKCIAATRRAIRIQRGLLTHAADSLGISLATLQKRISKYHRIAEAYTEQMERNLDDIQKNLMDAADERYPWAIKFYLQTQGRKRGFAEHVEHGGEIKLSGSVISKEEAARLSVEEIRKLVDIINRAKQPVLEAKFAVEKTNGV